MVRNDGNPFAFLFHDCHISPSQEELLRTIPFARQHEHCPDSSSSSDSSESPFSQPSYIIPMLDLNKDSDDHWGERSTLVIEGTGTEVLDSSSLCSEGSKGGDLGAGVVGSDGDRMFDEMPARNREAGIGVKEDGIKGFGKMSVIEDDRKGVVGTKMRNREVDVGLDRGDGPRRDGDRGFGVIA